MKRTLLLLLLASMPYAGFCQQIYDRAGSLLGRFEKGRLYDRTGSYEGKIESSRFYDRSGSFKGYIKDGRFYDHSGSLVGSTRNGHYYDRAGSLVGRISGGMVYDSTGSMIGRVKGVPDDVAALIFFFGFLQINLHFRSLIRTFAPAFAKQLPKSGGCSTNKLNINS